MAAVTRTPITETDNAALEAALRNPYRLAALYRTRLMDSPPEPAFDRLTRLAARLLGAPTVLITLVDDNRQFFKSAVGLPEAWIPGKQTPLSSSFCKHVVHTGRPLRVPNTLASPLVCNNRAVLETNIRAYLGVPLTLSDGNTLGSLCAMDTRPREWAESDYELLIDLAAMAVTETELRVAVREARAAERSLIVSHRFVRNIMDIAPLLIYVFDLVEQRSTFINQSVSDVLGYAPEHILAFGPTILSRLVHGDDLPQVRKHFGRMNALPQGEFAEIEYRTRHADGSWRRLHCRDTVFERDSNGRAVWVLGFAEDVTARRSAENALEAAREREMEVSASIQRTLLLRGATGDVPGLTIGNVIQPCQRIGGDYFDTLVLNDECVDILVGDVMGKGVPAALLAAAMKSQFQRAVRRLTTQLLPFTRLPEPEEVVASVHAVLTNELLELASFVTLVYARFDLARRELRVVDCGHPRILLLDGRTGVCRRVSGDNVPLGVLEKEQYRQTSVSLGERDLCLLYSDGITEAMNPAGEMFGEGRLIALLTEVRHLAPHEIVERVRTEVLAFSGGEALEDDFTCVAVRVEPVGHRVTHTAAIEVISQPDSLTEARQFVEDFCGRYCRDEMDGERRELLALAVNEALANIIRHSYRGRGDARIQIAAERREDEVRIHLHDIGEAFPDPTKIGLPVFDGSRQSGFGVFIMRRCVDDLRYFRDDMGRNTVTLIRRFASTAGELRDRDS
jgi:PAS domain S-box-containing protein